MAASGNQDSVEDEPPLRIDCGSKCDSGFYSEIRAALLAAEGGGAAGSSRNAAVTQCPVSRLVAQTPLGGANYSGESSMCTTQNPRVSESVYHEFALLRSSFDYRPQADRVQQNEESTTNPSAPSGVSTATNPRLPAVFGFFSLQDARREFFSARSSKRKLPAFVAPPPRSRSMPCAPLQRASAHSRTSADRAAPCCVWSAGLRRTETLFWKTLLILLSSKSQNLRTAANACWRWGWSGTGSTRWR